MNDLETKRPDIKCPNLVPTINDGWDRALASWITKERRRDIKHIPNQEKYDVDIYKEYSFSICWSQGAAML